MFKLFNWDTQTASFLGFFILFLFSVFSHSNAAKAPKACGVYDRCPDGYYCSGAVGESRSGICVANGINIVLCRGFTYVQSDIMKYFFLFGAVFAGIYFFMGKFTFMTFAQIMVGIGVLYGAANLVNSVLGDNTPICSKGQAATCFAETASGLTGSTTGLAYRNETRVRNLDKVNVTAKFRRTGLAKFSCDPLECVKAKCDDYTSTMTTGNNPVKECKLNNKTVDATVFASDGGGSGYPVGDCQAGFVVKCNYVKGSYERDYFNCKSCADELFAAEAPSAWKIADCRALVEKQIN